MNKLASKGQINPTIAQPHPLPPLQPPQLNNSPNINPLMIQRIQQQIQHPQEQ